MNILLTNDDGVYAKGINVLKDVLLKTKHNIYILAPQNNKSGTGTCLTLHKGMAINKIADNIFACNGTSFDCVYLALTAKLFPKPDIIVSGINLGYNLSAAAISSGTLGAALWGNFFNIPSFAISTDYKSSDKIFNDTSNFALKVTNFIIKNYNKDHKFCPNLNINYPNITKSKVKGYKICPMDHNVSNIDIHKWKDPRNILRYWIGEFKLPSNYDKNTDIDFYNKNYVTITPIKANFTDYEKISDLEQWFQNFS